MDDIKVHPALRRNNTLQIDVLPVCYSVMQLFLLNYQERNRADVYGFQGSASFYIYSNQGAQPAPAAWFSGSMVRGTQNSYNLVSGGQPHELQLLSRRGVVISAGAVEVPL